jgi:hypothetical protein
MRAATLGGEAFENVAISSSDNFSSPAAAFHSMYSRRIVPQIDTISLRCASTKAMPPRASAAVTQLLRSDLRDYLLDHWRKMHRSQAVIRVLMQRLLHFAAFFGNQRGAVQIVTAIN